MTHPTLTIRSVDATAVIAPLARPVRTAVGTIPAAPLVLVDVHTEEGPVGRAYVFAYTPIALPALHRLVLDVGAALVGAPALPRDLMRGQDRRFRLLGWQGLVGMAVSGIDMALWDALGRAAGQPVSALLGAAPRPIPAYDSFGAIDPATDGPMIEASLAAGFRAIKFKLGDGDLAADRAAAALVRRIAGPSIQLMADYNQSLAAPEAIRRIRHLADVDLTWIEEPVKAEDHAGHAAVRAAVATPIQTGENWWFPADMARAIAAGACDFAMPDLMKIGGVTGWTEAASLAAVHGIPVSSHLFVEASAHVLAATPTTHFLEYLDIAGAVLADRMRPVDGTFAARGPGLGMDWDPAAVARYRA